MKDERTPVEKAIWEGILKLVDELPPGTGGTSRDAGSFSSYPAAHGGTGTEGRTKYATYNPDGTKTVYEVIVTVRERVDSNDDFWAAQLRDRSGALVINGKHYRIGANNGRSQYEAGFKGFGGRAFEIRMLANGHVAKIDDLWYQGAIPPKFRELFPDNAEFTDPNQEPFRS